MQVHYYVIKDTLVDGTIDIGFVIVFFVSKIYCHIINDCLFVVVLTSRVVGSFSSIIISISSTFVNTMNNVSPTITSIEEESGFVQVPNIGGSVTDLEDTF
jgi:hypothetical protein